MGRGVEVVLPGTWLFFMELELLEAFWVSGLGWVVGLEFGIGDLVPDTVPFIGDGVPRTANLLELPTEFL